ncbi:MAG: 3-phosphoshikimate 1-carboxyvinyltransferase [Candidatus Melainabacteria bacterium HGW-Melainabacteria-1]|nr:MAG: 3-phosphoshikimate 1-carboxyvinyltransferase [Candidatus Melainabacteria bacterium HGW-Melainabacteria-1]
MTALNKPGNPFETVRPLPALKGQIHVPGDKSMSHRALIYAALAEGPSEIRGLLEAADVRSTWGCLVALGIPIQAGQATVKIDGQGLYGLKAATSALDCGNSGTTMRLLMGLLAGQPFASQLIGDASLTRRPMRRIAEPLGLMGANIELREGNFAPVQLNPAHLAGLDFALPVASAQLKSALLLAGLYAQDTLTLRGKIASRDHSERMLPHYGVMLDIKSDEIRMEPGQRLQPMDFEVPGDPSTAAFWLAAAAMLPGSDLELPGVSFNPSRLGFVRVLQRMGSKQLIPSGSGPEPQGTIHIQGNSLSATSVTAAEIPDLIDEVPLIAILATQALGRTEVRGAAELRVKESDRLEAIALNLRRMGGEIELFEDGFAIKGPQLLHGPIDEMIDPMHDHRIAMAFAIAGLVAEGETRIQDPACVAISYPQFFDILHGLKG